MSSISLRQILSRYHGVEVGDHTYGSLLDPGFADRFTTIGAYVSVGPNVRRFGAQHPLSSLSLHPYWYNPKFGIVNQEADVERTQCTIGHDSWIGANVTILPGCRRIGIGAVIGAGSVVTKDVADFTIVAGNPAKRIGERFPQEVRDLLAREKLWTLSPEKVTNRMKEIRFTLNDTGPKIP